MIHDDARTPRLATVALIALLAALPAWPSHGQEPESSMQVGAGGSPAIQRSASIRGEQGGMVVAGRFWLWVPAGAWKGAAEVSISVPDPGRLLAEVRVEPAPEGGFAVPLHLFAGLAAARDVQTASFATWDTDRRTWRASAAVVRDPGKRELHMPLLRPGHCAVLAEAPGRR